MHTANVRLPLDKTWPLHLSADYILGLDDLATFMREEFGKAQS